MLTVLIPLGDIPYFVKANLQNYQESCGIDLKDLDFVFVTDEKISEDLQAAIDAAHNDYPFRVWSAPIEKIGPDCHLPLLEQAIYEASVNEIVVIQHNDVFWQPGSNWLKLALAKIEAHPEHVLFTPDEGGQRFSYKGMPVLRTHGDILAIRTSKFKAYALDMAAGVLGTTVPVSEALSHAITQGEVTWTKLRRSASVPQKIEVALEADSTDGADILGLEAAVRFPELITTLNTSAYSTHLWHFYDMYYDISREGDKVIVNRTVKMAEVGMHYYAWVSSYFFDKDKMKDKILPWQLELQQRIGARDDFDSKVLQVLNRYAYTDNVIRDDCHGVTSVQFLDVTYPLIDL